MGFARVVEVATAGSTNADLMAALDAGPWPPLSVLVARHQTAGRGRGDREWVTPARGALTCSVVLQPPSGMLLTWVPLVVGVALRRALARWLDVRLKWPNDLVAGPPLAGWGWGGKIGGILCERHSSGAVVAGIGVNCRQPVEELPVPWARSLDSFFRDAPRPADVLAVAGDALGGVMADWERDEERVRAEYAASCATLTHRVRVEGPVGVMEGWARGIGEDGALILELTGGERRAITVGDVVRVR